MHGHMLHSGGQCSVMAPRPAPRAALPPSRLSGPQPARHPARSCPSCGRLHAVLKEAPLPMESGKPYAASTTKYAIIDLAGHQMVVEEGRYYTCNRLKVPIGSTIKLPRVLFCRNQEQIHIGQPYLDDVEVQASILEDADGPTIRVEKFKPKKHYRRRFDHTQPLTRFLVTKIAPGSS